MDKVHWQETLIALYGGLNVLRSLLSINKMQKIHKTEKYLYGIINNILTKYMDIFML